MLDLQQEERVLRLYLVLQVLCSFQMVKLLLWIVHFIKLF